MPLNPDEIEYVKQLFQRNQWTEPKYVNVRSVFNNFCDMLSLLSFDERELIYKLASNFCWIIYDDYVAHLRGAFRQLYLNIHPSVSSIFLVPLVPSDEANKSKSCTGMPYLVKNVVLANMQEFENIAVYDFNSINYAAKKISQTRNSLVVAIDDFLGTGDTATRFCDEAIDIYKVNSERLVVVTVASLLSGRSRLAGRGVTSYSSVVGRKGITESDCFDDKAFAKQVMLNIEGQLRINTMYSFGYGSSEALFSLVRTPNNTFPVFWCKKANNGSRWPAPFKR